MTAIADSTIDTLLNLDGERMRLNDGYWVKFDARKVTSTEHNPYGIDYSVTLHDRNNRRVLGYDNAHGFKPKKKKFGCHKVTWDHKHKHEQILQYEYESAAQLLIDFWEEVDRITGYSTKE
jgi:uncharacterized protein DUF6516